MCQQLFIVGHSAEVPTDHLVGSQRWKVEKGAGYLIDLFIGRLKRGAGVV